MPLSTCDRGCRVPAVQQNIMANEGLIWFHITKGFLFRRAPWNRFGKHKSEIYLFFKHIFALFWIFFWLLLLFFSFWAFPFELFLSFFKCIFPPFSPPFLLPIGFWTTDFFWASHSHQSHFQQQEQQQCLTRKTRNCSQRSWKWVHWTQEAFQLQTSFELPHDPFFEKQHVQWKRSSTSCDTLCNEGGRLDKLRKSYAETRPFCHGLKPFASWASSLQE